MKNKEEVKAVRPKPIILYGGAAVFILGFLTPLFIPIVVASNLSDEAKALVSGVMALGIPELFMILAAAILGKPGFAYLKRYIGLVFRKYGPPDRVSPLRYNIGLVLFILPILTSMVLPYFLFKSQFIMYNLMIITIVEHSILIISLFVLGGDFWEKLKGLFMYNAFIKTHYEQDK